MTIQTEKQYQKFILSRLKENGYEIRDSKNFDLKYVIDKELVFRFLDNIQLDEMKALRKIYKSDIGDILINAFNTEITKKAWNSNRIFKKWDRNFK